jgi:hypothetical protein
MADVPAHERVRVRVKEFLHTRGRGAARALARDVPTGKHGKPRGDQWVSDVLRDKFPQPITLEELDYIARHMQVAPGWLVRDYHHNYEECTMLESRLLMYFRSVPDTVRHGWMAVLEYLFSFQQDQLAHQQATRTLRTVAARKRETPQARRPVTRP